jgi:hypothetical protein
MNKPAATQPERMLFEYRYCHRCFVVDGTIINKTASIDRQPATPTNEQSLPTLIGAIVAAGGIWFIFDAAVVAGTMCPNPTAASMVVVDTTANQPIARHPRRTPTQMIISDRRWWSDGKEARLR